MHRIYLDFAASTPVDPEVLSAMAPYWSDVYGNPTAAHTEARLARSAVDAARATIARAIGAKPHELIFTSGGTEGNCLSILGLAEHRALSRGGYDRLHLVTTVIEHPSVLDCFRHLERLGSAVTYLPVTSDGIIVMQEFEASLQSDTALVSVMYANNEIGTIQPIQEIGSAIRAFRTKMHCETPYLHTDASQVMLFEKISVDALGVDLLTLDAQKLYGPKGVGGLYVRHGTPLSGVCKGGRQEQGLRPGTLNVPAIIGFAKSAELAEQRRDEDTARVRALAGGFFAELLAMPGVIANGSRQMRLPNNVNVTFPSVESEYMVALLDEAGVAAASKSACLLGGGEGSYVVRALDEARAGHSVRFSLGRGTTEAELMDATNRIRTILSKFS